MAALLTILVLLVQYLPLTSADTTVPLIPAAKFEAEPRQGLIRGLVDPNIDKRQTYYYCPAPSYTCEYNYCCTNQNYQCCRDGSCCWPNYYCVVGSNGVIGCCPNGKICSGPVDDPTTIHFTYTTTSTSTSTHISTSTIINTFDIPTTTDYPSIPSPKTSTSSSTHANFTTTTTASTSLTSPVGISTLAFNPSTTDQAATTTPNFASVAIRTTQNAIVTLAMSTLCIIIVIL